MKQLLATYQTRLEEIRNEMNKLSGKFDKVSNEQYTILSIKRSCYKLFIAELIAENVKQEIAEKF